MAFMKCKSIYALIMGSLIGISSMSTYAEEDQASNDENTVVGACMIQKFTEHTPPIKQSKIDKCADADSDAAPKCLGLSNDEYISLAKFCVAQLENAKCVSKKMKVSLMEYANCGYEENPIACYKGLGFTADAIVKLSAACQKEAE
jgi:hypothetical protein